MSLCINMSKPKQYSIHFKSNIIKEVDEGLVNNQELYNINILYIYIYIYNL